MGALNRSLVDINRWRIAMGKPIKRVFLGWDKPCLPQAVNWLGDTYAVDRVWDLGRVTIAVSGRRSGRRLLEVLVDRTQNRILIPPRIVTIGDLPELLYQPGVEVADPLTSLLARVQALRQADDGVLQAIIRDLPEADDLQRWVQLAQELAQLDNDLAGAGVGVGDVAGRCEQLTDFIDQARWEGLVRLQSGYEQLLSSQGLQDQNTARFEAIRDQRCSTDHDIVLLGTVDLYMITRRMLEEVGSSVTALIHAPSSQAEDFDRFGCVVVDRLQDRRLNLAPGAVRIVEQPSDQAYEVLQIIAGYEGVGADQITVAMGDESIGAMLQRTLESADVPARLATGRSVGLSRPVLLLIAIKRFIHSQRFDDFATLLRHPDLERYLVSAQGGESESQVLGGIGTWLTLLDRYATEHLQGRLTKQWLGDRKIQEQLKAVYDRVLGLLACLPEQAKPLCEWSQPIAWVLSTVYEHVALNRHKDSDADLIQVLELIGQALREQAQLDPASPVTPRCTAAQAIGLALSRIADQPTRAQGGGVAVELLGWLELYLDDAPGVIVTGMNEGMIPQSTCADAFLPDRVRGVLGLVDNRRRYARDLMMLSAIVHSRRDVTLIGCRRSGDDQPRVPSRLLLAGDEDQLVEQVERFYGAAANDEGGGGCLVVEPSEVSGFTVAAPKPPKPPEAPEADKQMSSLRVTGFGDYLKCPYRFYLKHVLKLRALDDQAVEMDGLLFGSLAHDVLRSFGQSDVADSTDANVIGGYLSDRLDQRVRRAFGQHRKAAVRVQCEHLRHRLRGFARWQADQASEGWQIVREYVEMDLEASIEVDGLPFTITGRIDRIDVHAEQGYRLLDYKTGDGAKDPDETHREGPRGSKRWIDLQLPLYRQLVSKIDRIGTGGRVELGYIRLPKDLAGIGLAAANWSGEELASALEEARSVVRGIRAGVFGPPTKLKDEWKRRDEYRWVCMADCVGPVEGINRSLQAGLPGVGLPGVGGGV